MQTALIGTTPKGMLLLTDTWQFLSVQIFFYLTVLRMRSLDIPRCHSLEDSGQSSESNKAKEKVDAMEVLFEYRGSRRQITASSGENLVECVTTELHRIGRSRAQVYTANVDLSTVDRSREIYLLQKWSPQWECYLDVNQASEINDGDRLAVVIKPKPPSKVNGAA